MAVEWPACGWQRPVGHRAARDGASSASPGQPWSGHQPILGPASGGSCAALRVSGYYCRYDKGGLCRANKFASGQWLLAIGIFLALVVDVLA